MYNFYDNYFYVFMCIIVMSDYLCVYIVMCDYLCLFLIKCDYKFLLYAYSAQKD